jgi:nucleoside-triphosphatase THEP1
VVIAGWNWKGETVPSTSYSSASPLAKINLNKFSPELIIVTGAIGSGKSTWCEKAAKQDQEAGFSVTGLLSISVFSGGCKVGIDLIDLSSGERRQMATLRGGRKSGLITDEWIFDLETLAWGNRVLKRIDHCDLFILDEMGPLEFNRKAGLQMGFWVIERRRYRRAIVVVRPGLLAQALSRWPDAKVVEVSEIEQIYDSSP